MGFAVSTVKNFSWLKAMIEIHGMPEEGIYNFAGDCEDTGSVHVHVTPPRFGTPPEWREHLDALYGVPDIHTGEYKLLGSYALAVERLQQAHADAAFFKKECRFVALPKLPKRPLIFITMKTRCKKCDPCREARRKLWSARAAHETSMSSRTWMITLTLRPKVRRALRAYELQGKDKYLELSKMVTKYVKRVKATVPSGALRQLIVIEKHHDGTPHVHLLLHETGHKARWQDIHDKWFHYHGFCEAHLVTNSADAGYYVSKYLSKDLNVRRVRASLSYGDYIKPQGVPPEE